MPVDERFRMRAYKITARSPKRPRYPEVWRCGAPWRSGGSEHELHCFAPKELEIRIPMLDESGLPIFLLDANGRPTAEVMTRVKIDSGTGAPVCRRLTWCQRADGSRVVECYSDAFEFLKRDELIDIDSIDEIKSTDVIDISDARPGESYEKFLARRKS
jgi:hypothetical protein